jgi:uncharacterized protein YcfJ
MKAILIFLSAMLASAAIAIAQPLPGTPAAAPAPLANPCDTCGSVTSVQYVEKKGEGSGAGLIAGGGVGGVLGHQIGSGAGTRPQPSVAQASARTLATRSRRSSRRSRRRRDRRADNGSKNDHPVVEARGQERRSRQDRRRQPACAAGKRR